MASEKACEEFVSFSAAVSSSLTSSDRVEQNSLQQLLCPSVVGQPQRRASPPSSSIKGARQACLWSLFPDGFFPGPRLMNLKIKHSNKQRGRLGHRQGNCSYSQVSGKPSVAQS